ncbi:hypothetical protein ES707_16153 [subsurface metagenome]
MRYILEIFYLGGPAGLKEQSRIAVPCSLVFSHTPGGRDKKGILKF